LEDILSTVKVSSPKRTLKSLIIGSNNDNNSRKEKDYNMFLQVEKNKEMYDHQYKYLVHTVKSGCQMILFNVLIINSILLLIEFISNPNINKSLFFFATHTSYYVKISNLLNFVIQFVKMILNLRIYYAMIKSLWKFSSFEQILYLEKRYWMKKYEQNINNKTFGLALQNPNYNSNIESNSSLLYNKYKPEIRVNIIYIYVI